MARDQDNSTRDTARSIRGIEWHELFAGLSNDFRRTFLLFDFAVRLGSLSRRCSMEDGLVMYCFIIWDDV